MLIFNSKKVLIYFLFLLLVFLFEGILCQPQIDIVIKRQLGDFMPFKFCKIDFFSKFWEENGVIENFQSFFLLASIILLLKINKSQSKENKIANLFFTLHIIGLIYYLGEEISWGQHFFNWGSPEFFNKYNHQNEINLHNISNLFDQLPRSLVLIWCGLSVPIMLLLNIFYKFDRKIFSLIYPGKKLIFVSVILLAFVLPDLIIDKFNLHPGPSPIIKPFFNSAYFYDIISFNFLRLSELHELIFSFYFFYYAYLVNKNFKNS